MAMEFKCGLMARDMKVIGSTIRLVAKENSGMLMGMCSKENGRMTKQMGMVYMFI